MRALGIVVSAPTLDDDLYLSQTVEDFTIEQFVPELGVEALAIADLPGRPRLDIGGSGTNGGDSVPHRGGDELRAIV